MPTDLKAPSGFAVVVAVGAFVALLVILFLVGWIPDHREKQLARDEAAQRATALPQVQVTKISKQTDTGAHDLILPCNLTANQVTALYTRANGYLKDWKYDIGQHVNQGDVMAVIDTPDVDAQLEQSKANLEQDKANVAKSIADLELAKVTYNR